MQLNYFFCVALAVKFGRESGGVLCESAASEQRAEPELLPCCPDAVRVTGRGFCHVEE